MVFLSRRVLTEKSFGPEVKADLRQQSAGASPCAHHVKASAHHVKASAHLCQWRQQNGPECLLQFGHMRVGTTEKGP